MGQCLIETQPARQATVAFVIGRVRALRFENGDALLVGDELLEKDAVGASNSDRQTRDLLELIVCQRTDEEVWSGANLTHGCATLAVARELKTTHVRVQRDRHDHEHGWHGEVHQRHNEENVVGIDATAPWRERGLGWLRWCASREAGKTSSATTAACATMHNTTVDSSTAVHCWWFFLHVNSAMVIKAVFYLYMHRVKITQHCRKLADFNLKRRHLENGRLGCGATNSWSMGARSTSANGACRSHTDKF